MWETMKVKYEVCWNPRGHLRINPISGEGYFKEYLGLGQMKGDHYEQEEVCSECGSARWTHEIIEGECHYCDLVKRGIV